MVNIPTFFLLRFFWFGLYLGPGAAGPEKARKSEYSTSVRTQEATSTSKTETVTVQALHTHTTQRVGTTVSILIIYFAFGR